MQSDPQMHSKVVDQVFKCLSGIEVQRSPGVGTVIFYIEEILHLCQNIINILFMVEICNVIRPGTQHDQKAHEFIFSSQSRLLVTDLVKAV